MKRIRVAHIINSMEVGGAQRQIVNLFHEIDSSRFEVRLICLAQKGILGESLEREGFTVAARVRGLARIWACFFAWRACFAAGIRMWSYCSVFTANLWGRLAGKLAGVPVLISHEQSSVSLEQWHRRAIDRFLARWTWKVLAVSEDLRGRILAERGLLRKKSRCCIMPLTRGRLSARWMKRRDRYGRNRQTHWYCRANRIPQGSSNACSSRCPGCSRSCPMPCSSSWAMDPTAR